MLRLAQCRTINLDASRGAQSGVASIDGRRRTKYEPEWSSVVLMAEGVLMELYNLAPDKARAWLVIQAMTRDASVDEMAELVLAGRRNFEDVMNHERPPH